MNRVLKSYKRMENKRYELAKLRGKILDLGDTKFDEIRENILYKKYKRVQEDLETLEFIDSVSDKSNKQELKEYQEDKYDRKIQKLEAIDNKINRMDQKISKLEYNREEYLHQLDHLKKEELKNKFAIEISESENNMEAKAKFEQDLNNVRKQIESTDIKLNITLARITINELRKNRLNESSVKKIEEIEKQSGMGDKASKFVATIKKEQYEKKDETRRLTQQNEYIKNEKPKKILNDVTRQKIEEESNKRFNEKIENSTPTKAAVYGTAGIIAAVRTAGQALSKLGSKVKTGVQNAIKNIKFKIEHRNQKLLTSGNEEQKNEELNNIEQKNSNNFVEKVSIDEKKAYNAIKLDSKEYKKENDDREVG